MAFAGGSRQIFTDARVHSRDPILPGQVNPIGHWEEETFVVDTIGLNGKTCIDESGLDQCAVRTRKIPPNRPGTDGDRAHG
jgi:hypothetical protein